MAGEREVLLDLIELRRGDDGQRVFLAIDGALLQRREDFGDAIGVGRMPNCL